MSRETCKFRDHVPGMRYFKSNNGIVVLVPTDDLDNVYVGCSDRYYVYVWRVIRGERAVLLREVERGSYTEITYDKVVNLAGPRFIRRRDA